MDSRKIIRRTGPGPESKGAKRLRLYMEAHGWYIKKIHGGKYQSGLPDFYCYHPIHGHRWIETKVYDGHLRDTQIREFSKMSKYGDKIYVLINEKSYNLLFKERDNWRAYWRR